MVLKISEFNGYLNWVVLIYFLKYSRFWRKIFDRTGILNRKFFVHFVGPTLAVDTIDQHCSKYNIVVAASCISPVGYIEQQYQMVKA